ncbi:MAG: amino acid ABC transporter ATP-binding protein [Lachnospiraceae bacterium]|nr:amino acid ABC transporter ATP-binding protein [Lachnospiraceae bacterium]
MAVLEVENLGKSFGGNQVLKNISFELEKGEVLAIIGSSGGGKTTLLRCLNQLTKPDSGSITVNNDVIFDSKAGKLSDSELRKKRLHFGLVFQQFNLFPQYNVFKNLTLAARLLAKENNKGKSLAELNATYAEIDKKAEDLLKKVGLTEKKTAYPCELSGGQQQRVAIARALILNPDILCFDEPTSALDPELTGEVLRVIEGLKSQDNTMIIVTHEMEFARRVASKIMFIADGVIEEIGTPEEVFEHPTSEKLKSFFNKSVEVIAGKEE